MRRGTALGAAALVLLLAGGCQTTPGGVLSIPVARDYRELPQTTLRDAEDAVDRARRAGAAGFAPYEYFSAEEYLAMARQQRAERNRAAVADYATLARDMAEAALRKDAGIPEAPPTPLPDSQAATQTEFDRIRARYDALDADKAAEVAPVLFARVTAGLSRAEFALGTRRGWREAARILQGVEPDLNTILWQDTDGDGIPDMVDAAPWLPEDFDGFEDEDGAPDPDNDRDGIPDVVDAQPNLPETFNRYQDLDGAPDEYPILESIYFPEGGTALSADAKGYLRGLKQFLDEYPELNLHVKGYADNRHSDVYGMELSQRRAQEVQRHLTLLGVAPSRLVATYHGQTAGADGELPDRVELVLE